MAYCYTKEYYFFLNRTILLYFVIWNGSGNQINLEFKYVIKEELVYMNMKKLVRKYYFHSCYD